MDERSPSRGRPYDEELARALGRTIKVLRTDMEPELSRRDLAERAGISYSYLTEIENGTKPASNTILGPIAETLGLQLHELIAAAESRMRSGEPPTEKRLPPEPRPPREWFFEDSPESPSYSPPSDPRGEIRGQRIAPPSTRRSMAVRSSPSGTGVRLAPHRASSHRSPSRAVMDELAVLVPDLPPDDQLLLLDMARRLASTSRTR